MKHICTLFIFCFAVSACGQESKDNIRPEHPIYCNPINLSYHVQKSKRPNPEWKGKDIILREGADPTITIFKDKYYLFSSVSDTYWRSDNLVNWEPLTPADKENLPIIYNYAPTVVVIEERMYLKDGNGGGTVYYTDTPDDPDSWKLVQGKSQKRPDSQFFLDDDGRLWNVYGCNNSGYLHIQELNTETFEIFGKTYSFNMPDIKNRGWERANNSSRGNNDRESHNWVEGSNWLAVPSVTEDEDSSINL